MPITRRDLLRAGGFAALGGLLVPALSAPAGASPVKPRDAASPAVGTDGIDRDSVFTRRGSGPLYWSTYGYDYPNNKAQPQASWQTNIDWVAQNLKPYGIDMACTDGWVDFTQKTNANGYILNYQDDWAIGWAGMASYLSGKGLKLGVYYNPLWVTKSAVADSSKTVIGRPDVPISAIVTAGDFFGGTKGTQELYWVDITKDGAKEFVQGYITYFKNLGAVYLRSDFWAWYETGYDQNMGDVGVAHGSANYATALQWISEAAGDQLELSVVMPNMLNHGATERRYGDLVRIDDDCGSGGWNFLDGGRQSWQNYWSQWHTPFAGFAGFSDISGRGQLILDGDVLEMNSFGSDDERRSAMTLFVMAGSPLIVGDRSDNIGSYLSFWQNNAILDINKQGFVGKPYYHSNTAYSSDTSSRDMETWTGQLPDGTWLVALFNTTYSTVTKSIDFAAGLGLPAGGTVHDVWNGTDLGQKTSYSASVPMHGVSLIKITPAGGGAPSLAAQVAAWAGGAMFNNAASGYTGNGYVDGLGGTGARVVFAAASASAATTPVTVRYANAGADATLTVTARNVAGTVSGTTTIPLPGTGSAATWKTAAVNLPLAAGTNLIALERTATDAGSVALDSITVGSGGGTSPTPPGAPGTPAASNITDTGATLTWTAAAPGSNPIAGYDVYQAGSPDTLAVSTTKLTAAITGLTAGTAYTFYVKAKDTAGVEGAASSSVQLTTTGSSGGGHASAKVDYKIVSDWGNGFTANLTLTNTGSSAIDNWTLAFTFPGNQKIVSGWSANWGQSGANVTAASTYNGHIAAGDSVTLGFTASYTGTNAVPAAFTVNGAPAPTG